MSRRRAAAPSEGHERDRAPRTAAAGAAERSSLALGGAVGIAAGFVVYALLLPLAETSFHFPGSGSYPAFEAATERAALLFLATAAAGFALGLVGGAIARPSAERGARLATAALGVYALALRGAWGYAGPLPAESAPAPGWLSVALPIAVAVGIIALLAALSGRREQTAGGASPQRTPWLPLHALFSLTAAILATQLAYYASRAGGFVAGLLEITRSVR